MQDVGENKEDLRSGRRGISDNRLAPTKIVALEAALADANTVSISLVSDNRSYNSIHLF